MNNNIIYIKNMVCPRCVTAVKGVMVEIGLPNAGVELGQVKLLQPLSNGQTIILKEKLEKLGFELLETGKSGLIGQIKTLIIDRVHHQDEPLHENFSSYLAEKTHHDYSYLSKLFSSVEGVTIEKYIARQKIEKVKELLFYNELTISEIAYRMHYSSVAYLSAQFKRETGMTPSEFRGMHKPGHRSLDSI